MMYMDSQSLELEDFDYMGDKALRVRGIALTEGNWNDVWFSGNEIKLGVEKLCPENVCLRMQLRANHSRDVWDVVGLVNGFQFDEKIQTKDGIFKPGVRYNAEVRLNEAVERVRKGLWGPVSVGVWGDLQRVETEEKDDKGNKKYRVEARNLEFEHLAWVTNPACKDAGITEILNSLKEEIKAEDNKGDSMKPKEGLKTEEKKEPVIEKGENKVETMTEDKKTEVKAESTVTNDAASVNTTTTAPTDTGTANVTTPVNTAATTGVIVVSDKVEPPVVTVLSEDKEKTDLKAIVESQKKMIEEQQKMINDLLDVKKNQVDMVKEKVSTDASKTAAPAPVESIPISTPAPAPAPAPAPKVEAKAEAPKVEIKVEAPATAPASKAEDTSGLVEKILALDQSVNKDDLMKADKHSLDVLYNFLIRAKEKQSVPGKGIVQSQDTQGIALLGPKKLTEMAVQAKGNAWVLGQIMKTLFARPMSTETYTEI